jgi:acetyl esterase/lipase
MPSLFDVEVRPDLSYRSVADGAQLTLDLYLPVGVPSAPVVVYVHGGAWLMGTRTEFAERLRGLAAQGVAVASIDYRTSNQASYPAQSDDILAAVAWIRDNADELGVSGGPVVVMGGSAGAHLAALTTLTADSRDIAGLVGLFGRYDLTAAATPAAAGLEVPAAVRASVPPAGFEGLDHRGKLALLAGVPAEQLSEERLGELSPLTHVHRGAPPVFLAHGTADALVHHSHSQRLAAALVDAGTQEEVTVMFLPGANHEDDVFATPHFLRTVAQFVDRCTSAVATSAHQ